jgi:hypothetical protein
VAGSLERALSLAEGHRRFVRGGTLPRP